MSSVHTFLKKRDNKLLLSSLLINIFFTSFLIRNLYPVHFAPQNLLFFDLIGSPHSLPLPILIFFGLLNILLLWFISKKIFGPGNAGFVPLIYSISPWSFYLMGLGSSYIYLLNLLLIATYGFLLIRNGNNLGEILLIGGGTLALYSFLATFFILPISIVSLIVLRMVPFSRIKRSIIWLILLSLPIFLFAMINSAGVKNIYNNQVSIFQDPGLLNSVNNFQGEAQKAHLGYLAKLSENKYIYFAKYTVLKLLKNFMPSTYFTSQEKLLHFSFSPPIYLGFLMPFSYGFYLLVLSKNMRKYLILFAILAIPSLLSRHMADLNSLVLFSPVFFFIIIYGLFRLFDNKKIYSRIFLYLCIALVTIQFLVTLSDLKFREYPRYERNFGINFKINN